MSTPAQRIKQRLIQTLYDVLVTLSVPFFLTLIYFKGRKNPSYRQHLSQRLARKLSSCPQHAIWFHAVSDGEFYAAKTLINQFLTNYPNTPILITTTTPTGKARVESEFGPLIKSRVWHAYLPFDQGGFTRRFVRTLKPQLAVFVETEIWPNFLESLNAEKVPCALINARLSEKSFLGYQRFGTFAAATINRYTLIICQDHASAQRFERLLAPATSQHVNIVTSGNLKLDITAPTDIDTKCATLRQQLGDVTFWVAASTHVGEDDIVIRAHQALRQNNPDLKLVIAPRHPERSDDIVKLCDDAQLISVRFSDMVEQHETYYDIVILDSIGQLLYFYAECAVAVIAGSFVAHGGHNPLEACLFRKPVITGPHYFNFQTMIDTLLSVKGIKLTDDQALVSDLTALLTNPEPLASNGHHYLNSNRGTTQKTYAWLQALQGESPA